MDFLGSRQMETAPTSIEVLLRPTLGQSDEPSDLRGSLSPTSVYNTWQSQNLSFYSPLLVHRMSFEDWKTEFQRCEICYLGPDTLLEEDDGTMVQVLSMWEGDLHEGSWRKRVNAGGCRNYPCKSPDTVINHLIQPS